MSEFEIYYIETLEGEIFCGEYVEIPALNYQPTTYNLIGMTGQTSCPNCILLNPCPTGITVDLNSQYSTTALVNDCSLKTIFPMEVSCVKTLPSETDSLDGQVGLYIVGGTPPYSIFTGTSTTAVGQSTNGQTFQVYSNVSAGTYTSIVYDFYGDYIQTVNCVTFDDCVDVSTFRYTLVPDTDVYLLVSEAVEYINVPSVWLIIITNLAISKLFMPTRST